jgi:adenine-specific DNA glycosylase
MPKTKNQAVMACDEEWEIERDLDAIVRAKAVQKDPERMKKVRALAKKRIDENKRRRDAAQAMVDMGEGKNP